nr:uncharacterized protein LOC127349191 [Lolium perenne]
MIQRPAPISSSLQGQHQDSQATGWRHPRQKPRPANARAFNQPDGIGAVPPETLAPATSLMASSRDRLAKAKAAASSAGSFPDEASCVKRSLVVWERKEKKNLTALQLEAMVETSGSCRAWSGRAGSRAGRGDGIRGGGESRLICR